MNSLNTAEIIYFGFLIIVVIFIFFMLLPEIIWYLAEYKKNIKKSINHWNDNND